MGGGNTVGSIGTLSEGTPCLRHHCHICCLETEMPLTEDDLNRIKKLGFKYFDFVVEEGRETHLKNMNNVCFFLESGRCKIYKDRPEGCRIYPLVYDVDKHRFVTDPICPHNDEFKLTNEGKDRLKRLIKRLDKEAVRRR